MSGLVKSVGKVFKKVAKSKVVKGLLIAAAVYYTAGLAGGAMGNTTMANLPGIKGAADFLGMGDVGAFAAGAPPPNIDIPSGLQTTPLADASAPVATDIAKGPDAAGELAAQGQPLPSAAPAAAPQGAPVSNAAPAQPPAADATLGAPKAPGTGVPKSALSWWQNLSPGAQQILAQGFAGGAAGMMQALAAKNAQEDAEAREQRMRDDRMRRGSVPDFSSGIIDRRRGA